MWTPCSTRTAIVLHTPIKKAYRCSSHAPDMAQQFSQSELPLCELVEAQGHLIDSHIMERIFDTVVEFGGNFEVEQFSIGRTNSEASSLRLRVTAPSGDAMEHMMTQLLGLGCAPVDSGDAELRTAERA